MTQKRPAHQYILGGFLALVAAFPLATGSVGDTPLAGSVQGVHGEQAERAQADRANQSRLQRLRWTVMDECQREGTECPDPSDVEALRNYGKDEVHEAAPDVISVIDLLGDYERAILRRSIRSGQCPEGLDGIVLGFQELCDSAAKDGNSRLDQLQKATKRARRATTPPSQNYRAEQPTE